MIVQIRLRKRWAAIEARCACRTDVRCTATDSRRRVDVWGGNCTTPTPANARSTTTTSATDANAATPSSATNMNTSPAAARMAAAAPATTGMAATTTTTVAATAAAAPTGEQWALSR